MVGVVYGIWRKSMKSLKFGGFSHLFQFPFLIKYLFYVVGGEKRWRLSGRCKCFLAWARTLEQLGRSVLCLQKSRKVGGNPMAVLETGKGCLPWILRCLKLETALEPISSYRLCWGLQREFIFIGEYRREVFQCNEPWVDILQANFKTSIWCDL